MQRTPQMKLSIATSQGFKACAGLGITLHMPDDKQQAITDPLDRVPEARA